MANPSARTLGEFRADPWALRSTDGDDQGVLDTERPASKIPTKGANFPACLRDDFPHATPVRAAATETPHKSILRLFHRGLSCSADDDKEAITKLGSNDNEGTVDQRPRRASAASDAHVLDAAADADEGEDVQTRTPAPAKSSRRRAFSDISPEFAVPSDRPTRRAALSLHFEVSADAFATVAEVVMNTDDGKAARNRRPWEDDIDSENAPPPGCKPPPPICPRPARQSGIRKILGELPLRMFDHDFEILNDGSVLNSPMKKKLRPYSEEKVAKPRKGFAMLLDFSKISKKRLSMPL
ncbi:hypothetical protein HK101_007499 [Irineochytrium annulatum]|nr:hypothetical protein HK101_007499 [Irineochytrium annulatum]